MSPSASPMTSEVGHYENFPVASWLCPAAIRPAVVAIYHFARTADDLADEGQASASERLDQLLAYRAALAQCLSGQPHEAARWPQVFGPLARAIEHHRLPGALLHDLLSAFEQDVRHTASGHVYADTAELLAYCRLSANPVGRLLLHLYGIHDDASLRQSDAVCSALQLINFWQDISVDHARGRHYLPADALQRQGLRLEDFSAGAAPEVQARCQKVVCRLCEEARTLMLDGAPLARRIPGRAGWELRLVVQGGMRILDKMAAIDHRSWLQRPSVGKADLPLMLWRALTGANLSLRRPAD
ncbi:squalene synthase HpnC [Hydrogenophaga pseudoflava]|uniref:squalene synthase HpnC n=1 Tax=Hydrogenophaga pseudoflava TaxID=47421 RepID=UPI0027E4ADD3|nr:squalene synthase HpnC [Hydrogenophaga pseudoflava]MDQ7744165.1 squalene synthase HpnC [Hydrogenophaga pseudoflava]